MPCWGAFNAKERSYGALGVAFDCPGNRSCRGRDRSKPVALAVAAGSPRRLPHGRRIRLSQRREDLGMSIGTSIFLIAVGAIIRYAVTFHVSGVSRPVIGLILIIAGIVGVVLSLIYAATVRGRVVGGPYEEPRL